MSGCSCGTFFVDASTSEKTSLQHTFVVRLDSVSESCRMGVQVVPMSTSGGHRFKISSVMVRALKTEASAGLAPARRLLMLRA